MRHLRFLISISLCVVGCTSAIPDSKRIEEAERSGICHVHGEQMKKERLRIAYGLIGFPKELSEARVARFPFARRALLGGCVIMTVVDHPELSSPEFGEAFVCSRCTAAKDRWARNHPALSKSLLESEPASENRSK